MAKNAASGHHHTNLSGCSFVIKAYIDNRKKVIKQQYLPQTSLQYGELRPANGGDRFTSLGHEYAFGHSAPYGPLKFYLFKIQVSRQHTFKY